MKTLRDYRVAGALYVNDTGIEAQVGDQVTLYLDQDAEPGFPESMLGVIQHPIQRVECDSVTSYVIEYDEADLNGAAALLRAHDIINARVISGAVVVANALEVEIARALAAEALLAPKASPTFTGTVVLPATVSIGTISSAEIGYISGVTSSIQTQLGSKAPHVSPTFTGTVVLPGTTSVGTVSSSEIGYLSGVTSAIQTQLNAKSPLASPSLTGTVGIAGGITQTGTDTNVFNAPIRHKGYTVAGLAGLTPAAGDRAFVTDANATTFASIVAGGGANVVPVFYDGTNWIVA